MLYFLKFGETFLKSNSTQKRFKQHLKRSLNTKGIKDIQDRKSYFLVKTDLPVQNFQNVFGVEKIEQIKYIGKLQDNLENIYEILNELVNNYNFQTFRVTVKRENKFFHINSLDLQMILGKYINENFGKTPSYKHFDLEINVRILKNEFWLRTSQDSFTGIAGLPYACEGKSLMLFSGGMDSPVASFLAAKRGIGQDFLFINTTDSELLLSQVFQIYKYLREEYCIFGKFFCVDASSVIKTIKAQIPAGYRQIVFKVFLYKLANLTCKKLKLNSFITGENIGQVSTQTLSNLQILNHFSDVLHIRPVACFDKSEIIKIAKKIGTCHFSEKIKETCQIENHSDSMIKNLEFVEQLFSSLNIDFQEIIENAQLVKNTVDIEQIERYKVKEIIGEIIDIENEQKIPKLEEGKQYTFVCSSGYKASTKMLQTRAKGYETYFLVK